MLITLLYLLGRDVDAMKKNAETPLIDSKETCLEVNAEKTKYVHMSHELIAGKNCCIKLGNKSFESVTKFRYFGTTPTNKKTVFMKEIQEQSELLGMLATVWSSIFCHPILFPDI